MNVLVYNWEKFERTKLRYLAFTVVFASVLLLSLLNNNIVWAVLLFFLLWGYFYYSTINNQIVTMNIDESQLSIGNKRYDIAIFRWYVLEIYPKTQSLKNIVFLTTKWHMIYTFKDSPQNINDFLETIDKILPMLDAYDQGIFEKMSRKIKL